MKALPSPLKSQAAALRQLATSPDAQEAIDRATVFELDGTEWHNSAHLSEEGGDIMRGHNGPEYVPPYPITPMELIDDACALEAIADKIAILKGNQE